MCKRLLYLPLGLCAIPVRSGIAETEPEIAKDNVSIHKVERGNMPLLLALDGEVVALEPPPALVTVPAGTALMPQIGQKASIQIKAPDILNGRVVSLDRAGSSGVAKVRIELGGSFPANTPIGTKLGSITEVGKLSNVVFFARPATARANGEMALFVIAPNDQFAERTTVRFGRQSGPWIEILSGLSPGDCDGHIEVDLVRASETQIARHLARLDRAPKFRLPSPGPLRRAKASAPGHPLPQGPQEERAVLNCGHCESKCRNPRVPRSGTPECRRYNLRRTGRPINANPARG